MESLFILIPIALVLVYIAIRVFMWAVKSGQFEDLDTEGKRILFDNDTFEEGDKTINVKEMKTTEKVVGRNDI